MGLQCCFVCCVSFFLGLVFSLSLLVILQCVLILLLLLLVVGIGSGIVVINTLVIFTRGGVVVINRFVVIAHCVVVVLGAHAVGVGHGGFRRQLQIGIDQRAVAAQFIAVRNIVVVLLGLIVAFDDFLIVGNDLVIGLLDFAVDAGGLDLGICCIVLNLDLIHGQIAAGQDIGIFQLSSLGLSGQCDSHCHGNGNSGAGLGQELLVILLSHNFNLLFILERLKYWRPGCHSHLLRPLSFASRPFGRFAVSRYFLFTVISLRFENFSLRYILLFEK